MFWWVSVAEYTSRMDTEPLGALGMDLDHTYDAVKIRECSHTSFHTYALLFTRASVGVGR